MASDLYAKQRYLINQRWDTIERLLRVVGEMQHLIQITGGTMDAFQATRYDALSHEAKSLQALVDAIDRLMEEQTAQQAQFEQHERARREKARKKRAGAPPNKKTAATKLEPHDSAPTLIVDFPEVVPLVAVSEPQEVRPTTTHVLTAEIDSQARAVLSWAPWARRNRNHRSRIYEGFGGGR